MQASPNRIGKYELISRLGRGGMGEVYKAYHPQLQRFVAIKVLVTSSETDPEFITRFQNEALAVARLRHPNIVQVYDFDLEDKKPYMVMEYVEGETLSQRIARYHQAGQRAPIEEVVRLFQQLCSAVDYAHKQGMLHRDIKPANVLLNQQGDAVLTDFGLVKIGGVSGLTASGSLMGTPHYMSPEQGQGQPVDARSDVYSLSVMLYEMLAGRRPFDADTPVRIVMQHVMEPPPPIEQFNPAVPPALAQVALVGMAKNPDERFRSAAALGAAITAAFNASPAHIASAPARPIDTPDAPALQAAGGGNIGLPPPAVAGQPAAKGQLVHLAAHAPGNEQHRRKPSSPVGRYVVIGIILLLIISSGGILLIALSNKPASQTGITPASSVGSVTFTDSNPNDFTHPADTLQATFSNLRQPAAGATYFAWLCNSGSTTCTLLGAVVVQHNGSATLSHAQSASLLGVSDLANLATTLTFEITQEQTEPSAPPNQPSKNIVYAGQIQSAVLLHIRHQLVAFPNKGELFPGNTTALDTGLGVDAALLNQLAQQLQAAPTLTDQQVAAEEMLNLIAGKAGQQDWNQDGQTSIADGDDGFGMGTSATVNAANCSGSQNTSYLDLTMQHACLAARASGTTELSTLFTKIKAAGANIAAALATMQPIAQKIAQATTANAFSQGDVNTLVQTADAILNGVSGETSQQDGARQILLYSEAMATITINPA